MTATKICGLSTPEAVDAAVAGGAAYLGFVFFPGSPRSVTAEQASALARRAQGHARSVALLVDPDEALLEDVLLGFDPDMVQLHGIETPQRVAAVRAAADRPVIKALAVAQSADLDAASAYAAADYLMFDAKPPADAERPGGLGLSFDWSLLHGRAFGKPWFLAGGLTPGTVGDAVRTSGAPMVDVSSGVERAPGVKDPALIAAFLDAVRQA